MNRPRLDTLTNVVFYDGVCALCNGTVKALLRIDKAGVLHFAPIQGITAEQVKELKPNDWKDESIIFYSNGLLAKSAALIAILLVLGGGWRSVAAAIALVPRPVRDFVYDLVARHRYRWFGKYETCPLPPSSHKLRFLP